jgi:hypothetical protein
MRPLQVGDLCITQNADHPVLNNGLLVVITAVDPARSAGDHFQIRRVDGQPIPSCADNEGKLALFKMSSAWAHAYKLRRVDPDVKDESEIRGAELQA